MLPSNPIRYLSVCSGIEAFSVAVRGLPFSPVAFSEIEPFPCAPRECECLQGFPDDYTAITFRGLPAADSPRYRALGNSKAVPVVRWLAERILRFEPTKPGARSGYVVAWISSCARP